jgi:hypothetical protein
MFLCVSVCAYCSVCAIDNNSLQPASAATKTNHPLLFPAKKQVPLVGNALLTAENGQTAAARQAGATTGVTRMLYGSIASTWGRKANGSLAAWHNSLLSV